MLLVARLASRWFGLCCAAGFVYEQLRQVERQHQLLQEMKSSLRTARSQIHHMKSNEAAEPVQIQLFNSLF